MELKRLLHDDDAVSPVIGVILMVAITVILAAVIASFVLGLGGNQQATPTASFTFDYTEGNDAQSSYIEVTHDGGDTIQGSQVYLRGSDFATDTFTGGSSVTKSSVNYDSSSGGTGEAWADVGGSMSANKGEESAIAAGDSITIQAPSTYELRVVWQPGGGDTSATLGQDSGPDA